MEKVWRWQAVIEMKDLEYSEALVGRHGGFACTRAPPANGYMARACSPRIGTLFLLSDKRLSKYSYS